MKKKKRRMQKFFCLLLAGFMLLGGVMPYAAYALEQPEETELSAEVQTKIPEKTEEIVFKESGTDVEGTESEQKKDSTSEPEKSESSREGSTETVDITETLPEETKEEILSVAVEEQKAVVDELTMQYLKDHTDPRYTGAKKIELVNVLRVKQTLVDRRTTSSDETIDGMFASDEMLEKYLATVGAFVAVYNLDDASDYYVSYANTMQKDDADLTDWVFAKNNVDGEVVEGCVLDTKTGIAYIPKSLSKNEKGKELLNSLQIQMLQRVSFGEELHSKVQTVTNTENALQAAVVQSGIFDESVVVKTEKGLDAEELVVSANGIPLTQEEDYHYNAATGEVELSASAASLQTVSICQEEAGLAEKIAKAFRPTSVLALSKWTDMKPFVEDVVIPDWVKTGTYFSGKAPYAYTGVGNTSGYNYNTYAYNVAGTDYVSDSTVDQLAGLIYNGGSVDVSKVGEIEQGLYIRFSFYSCPAANSATGAAIKSSLKSDSQGSGKAMDWSQFGSRALRLVCGHASKSYLGSYSGPQGGKYDLMPAAVRFLKVDRDAGYAVLGILTCTTHTQEGVGMVRITLKEEEGYVYMRKLDADPDTYPYEDTMAYKTVAGCDYTVYTDSGCTKIAKQVGAHAGKDAIFHTRRTKNADGHFSNLLILTPGKYYMRETLTSPKYRLNNKIYSFTIIANKTIYLGTESSDTGKIEDGPTRAGVKIKKVDADNTGIVLSGAVYFIYEKSTCLKEDRVVDEVTGKLARLETGADGNSNTVKMRLRGESRTFYIKEAKPPEGYDPNETVYNITLSDGQVGSITVKDRKTPDGGGYLVKTSTTDAEEIVAGAVYYIYTDSSCSTRATVKGSTELAKFTTTSTGSNTVYLEAGQYYVKEYSAPSGYEKVDTVYPVTIKNGVLTRIAVSDPPSPPPPVKIKKVSASDPSIVVAGATYIIYRDADCETQAKDINGKTAKLVTTKTDSNTVEMKPGTYYIREVEAPDGYQIDETVYTVTLKAGQTTPYVLNVKDEPTDGSGKVRKTSTADPDLVVPEAEYTVYTDKNCSVQAKDINGNPAKFTTNTQSSNTVELYPGTYYVKETRKAPGYKLDTTPHPITIVAGEETTIEVQDEPEDGDGKIKKTSSIDPTKVVAGAVYKIYTNESCSTQAKDVNGNAAQFTTTTSGSNTVTLAPGFYYVKEFTPAPGFEKNETVYEMEILSNVTTTVPVQDVPSPGFGQVVKKDSVHASKVVIGAEYTIYMDADCTQEAETWDGGKPVLVTTASGSNPVKLPVLPNGQKYYVKETKAAENYELDSTVHPLTITSNQTTTLNVTNIPFGELELMKVSTKPNLTNGNAYYSLAGAVYEVYSDAGCRTKVGTLTTKEDGTTNTIIVKQGIYYVKEITPAKGFKLCDGGNNDGADRNGVHTVQVSPGKKATFTCKEEPHSGFGKVVKKDSVNKIKTVAGAEYTIYTDSACMKKAATWDGTEPVLVTTESGSNTVQLPVLPNGQKYYVKETKAAENYELDPAVYPITITNGQTYTLNVTNIPFGELDLRKESAKLELTNGNPCYSLEGAVYEVFANEAMSEKIGELITKADGATNTLILKQGTYYVKEKTASPGYKLCDGTTGDGANRKGVHIVKVEPAKKTTFTCKEEPIHDPFLLRLQKLDADSGKSVPAGTASLEGAQFEVTYFANTTGNVSRTPTRTWVFETDANGMLRMNDPTRLVEEKSDALYYNEDQILIYPLGTYRIREIQAPKYYQMKGTLQVMGTNTRADVTAGVVLVLAEENDQPIYTQGGSRLSADNLALNVFEEVHKGSVRIQKKDTNGRTPLAGVEFTLKAPDGSLQKVVTDKNGTAVFENLIPQTYVLTETKTVNGHSLLAEPIEVTLPLTMTEEEIAASGADKSKAVWDEETGCYCFYDATYTITNSVTLDMPMTGGNPVWMYLMMGAAAICIVMGLYFKKHIA